MARLVDAPEEQLEEATEVGTLEELEPEAADVEAEEVEQPQASEDDLPEKYRGKSASEIATMHRELEQRLGQQS